MASRRSRLQIKPNIGGPKGLGAKPSPKPADPKLIKQENTVDTAAREKNGPRKSVSVGATSDKTEVQHLKIEGVKNKSSEKEVEIPQTNSNEPITVNDVVLKPGLRRFTKPSFATTRSKTNSPVKEVKQTSDVLLKNEKEKNSESENVSDANSTNATVKKDAPSAVHLDKEQQENMAKSTPIPRRSRFPKAKPNVIDASKKRPRSVTEQVCAPAVQSDLKNADPPKGSPQKKETTEPTFPREEMLIVNEDEVVCERSIHLDEGGLSEPPSSPQPFIPPKSPVKAPSGLTSITTSPVKQPQPSINRTRTISVSEAPVTKKPRRPKLDIPTDKPPDRSVMRMRDLIRWNPSSNPMKQKQKPENKQSVTTLDGEKENKKTVNDDVDKQGNLAMETEEDADSALPVPQVTIGPDGNIVINEKSLVVHDNSAEKGPSQEDDVIDETENTTTYASFRKRQLSKKWTNKETARFYKALAMIGLDFFLIQKAFPSRTRTEIKRKFKREEKINSRLVEKVLQEQIHFDERFLDGGKGDTSEEEVAVEPVKVKKEKKTKRAKGQQTTSKKPTKKSKEKGPSRFEYIDEPSDAEEDIADEKSSDKEDETWKPSREVAKQAGGRDSRQFSKRVVLTKKQAMGGVNTQENTDMMYTATPISDMPVINKIGASSGIATHQTFSVTPSEQSTSAVNRHGILSMEARTSGSTGIANEPRPVQGGNFVNNGELDNMPSQRTDENVELVVRTVPEVGTSLAQGGVADTASSASDNTTIIMSSPISGSQLTNMPDMTDSSDQYVLVTVRPDGSEETVIHIYKLPTSPRPVMSPPPVNYQPQVMSPPRENYQQIMSQRQINYQQQDMYPPPVNNQPPVKSPPPMNCQPQVMSPVS